MSGQHSWIIASERWFAERYSRVATHRWSSCGLINDSAWLIDIALSKILLDLSLDLSCGLMYYRVSHLALFVCFLWVTSID